MKLLHLFIISIGLIIGSGASAQAQTSTDAQAGKQIIEEKIVSFFDAMNAYNYQKMRKLTSDRFVLLENGARWTTDSLITVTKGYEKKKVKMNHTLSSMETTLNGETAWITYKNKGVFNMGKKKKTFHFLESAVFTKGENGWKMELLHSTKLKTKPKKKKD